MLERHENEQYFWTAETRRELADVAARFENPCCLCAPMLGEELVHRQIATRILDTDERFSHLVGFGRFDLYRPSWLGEAFGVVICDPPFWIVSLSQLFAAIRLLSRHDYSQPLAICYPTRRGSNLCGTFSRFGLKPTGYFPRYVSVQSETRNEIEFFANFNWPSE